MEIKILFWIIVGVIWLFVQLKNTIKRNTEVPPEDHKDIPSVGKRPVPASNNKGTVINKNYTHPKPVNPPAKPLSSTLEDLMEGFGMPSPSKVVLTQVSGRQENNTGSYGQLEGNKHKEDEEVLIAEKIRNDRKEAADMNEGRIMNTFEHFNPYNEEKSKRHPLYEMIKDPVAIKNAFLLGEIFQRKY
jgi:hypothetical protein